MGDAFDALVAGRLDARIDAKMPDGFARLAEDYNGAVAALADMLGGIVAHVETVSTETSTVARLAEEQTARGEDRAKRTRAFSTRLSDLSDAVKSTTVDLRETVSAMEATHADAEAGAEVMARATGAMQNIESAQAQMRQVIEMIEDIAFQTNLLALNAGVEAARAGSAGRGFSVVATEVRALATRAAEAVGRIDALLGRSETEIRSGAALVDETGTRLAKIKDGVDATSDRLAVVAAASTEHAGGIGRLDDDLRWIDDEGAESSLRAVEIAKAMDGLRAEAADLHSQLQRFRLGGSAQSDERRSA